MTDAVKMRMVIPFQFEKQTKKVPIHEIWLASDSYVVWPFSETNGAAKCTTSRLKPAAVRKTRSPPIALALRSRRWLPVGGATQDHG
jgi:hypothetical protein